MENGLQIGVASPEGFMPSKATSESAGFDLRARLDRPLVVQSLQRCLIPTGVRLEMPPFIEAQIRPRSGLAIKHGITVLNSPGTIDADYRGEVGVILFNSSNTPFTIQPGDRIAQMVFSYLPPVCLVPVEELSATERGEGGYGSTGVSTNSREN